MRHGSICVVTGASRGVGRGIALELAAAGSLPDFRRLHRGIGVTIRDDFLCF